MKRKMAMLCAALLASSTAMITVSELAATAHSSRVAVAQERTAQAVTASPAGTMPSWSSLTSVWFGGIDQVQCVNGPVISGSAGAFTIIGGTSSNRCEIIPKAPNIYEGDVYLTEFSTYVSSGFPVNTNWQVLAQWHDLGDAGPPVQFAMEQWSRYPVVSGGWSHPWAPPFQIRLGEPINGQWNRWSFLIRFSVDPAKASITVRRNGQTVLNDYHPASGTLHPRSWPTPFNYFKIGYYRAPGMSQTATVNHRDLSISRVIY